ncbi:MAG: hypothetical protein WD669_03680 [Pirellulales bacterium]
MDTIDTPYPTPLTAEQLAAIAAGGGWARVKDPNTQRVFVIAEEIPPTVDDAYFREKIEEAYADAAESGGFQPLDMTAIKAELERRLNAKNAPR